MRADKSSNLPLYFILITILLDMIGVGIIVPVMPELILELTGEQVSGAAKIGGYLIFIYAFLQFIFSPILGNLADRFGRRPVLLISLVGLTADYLFMAFAPTLALLFVGRAIAGIAGATVATATAYIVDISPPEKRAGRFGLIGAAFGLGFIIGPVIGGELGEISARAPFFAAAALAFANFLFGIFILPESLGKRKRRRFKIARANPFGALMALAKYPAALWLIGCIFLFALAGQVYPAIWNFFTIERFDWSTSQIGRSLAVFGILFALAQGFLIRPAVKKLGENTTVMIGMLAAVIAFMGLAFIATPVGLYGFLMVGAFSGLAPPAINSILSRQVPENAQGELQGAITAANALTAIIGPLAATQLFSYFTSSPNAPGYFPGVSFFVAGILVTLALSLFIFTVRKFALVGATKTSPETTAFAHPGEVESPTKPVANSADAGAAGGNENGENDAKSPNEGVQK